MPNLIQIQQEADLLDAEERAGLAAHLLSTLPHPMSGADDEEVARREEEMDSGSTLPISHEQFLAQARP